MTVSSVSNDRALYSRMRLTELRNRVSALDRSAALENLVIFCAGSYAREEASEYSDIDLFFVYNGAADTDLMPRTNEIKLFGTLIKIASEMNFPAFSNDSQYLTTTTSTEMLNHLGSPKDDAQNLFTIRMLMLLESKCVDGDAHYAAIQREIINSYYRDYPDHEASFQPWFLLNDIARFWKTLLLNYEHKRNQNDPDTDRTRQKVRNFKLKFSRMTTCFATIAALACYDSPVSEGDVFNLVQMTPQQRLGEVSRRHPRVAGLVNEVLEEYTWFLTKTGLPGDQLEAHFRDKEQRFNMFDRANRYGDKMFSLLVEIDRTEAGTPGNFLRYLVV